ncbi:hypothetical protein AAC387_Pa09g1229 [Persea americana]
MAMRWKSAEDHITSLKSGLEDARGKISQLGTQHNLMSENLMDAVVKSNQLIVDAKKSANENESLKKELLMCLEEKKDMEGKIRMNSSELTATKASLNKMNTISKKLNDILCNQKLAFGRHGIGYTDGANSCYTHTLTRC